jgi:hypothetical protein
MPRRQGVPLSAEARRILHRSHTVLVGTVSAHSRPFLTPIYYLWLGGEIFVASGPRSWTGRNIRVNPQVTLVFGGERGGGTARLRVTGPAQCLDGWMPRHALVLLALRYYLAPRALRDQLRHLRQMPLRSDYYAASKGQMGYIRVRPVHVEVLDAPEGPVG